MENYSAIFGKKGKIAMSRLAKKPIHIPSGVEMKQETNQTLIKGPKGEVKIPMVPGVSFQKDGDFVAVQVDEAKGGKKAFSGLYRALLLNGVEGASKGFKKELTLIGVGFRCVVQGHQLDLQLGFSHPTKLDIPKGITVTVQKSTSITVEGADKQQVGQFAATIRALRKPEPYKGKGIRYKNEYVRKKAGKASK